MGGAVPGDCAPNAIGTYECERTESSIELDFMWVLDEGVQRKHVAMHTVAASTALVELMEEEEEGKEEEGMEEEKEVDGEEEESMEEGKEKGYSIKKLTPTSEQTAMPYVPMPNVPEFWASGPGAKLLGMGLPQL